MVIIVIIFARCFHSFIHFNPNQNRIIALFNGILAYLFYYVYILLFQLPFNILTCLILPLPPPPHWMNQHTNTQLLEVDVFILLITPHNYKKKNNLKIKLNRTKREANGQHGMVKQNEHTSLSLIHFNGGNELFVVFLWNISLFLAVYSLFATIDDAIKFQALSQWITSNAYRCQQPTGSFFLSFFLSPFLFVCLIKVGPIYAQAFGIEKLLTECECDTHNVYGACRFIQPTNWTTKVDRLSGIHS